MTFNHQQYNQLFLTNIGPVNGAGGYGVEVLPALVNEGEMYWRVIGVHHLLPEENMSNHHVYFDVLDEYGNRVRPPAWIGWTWEGRGENEPAPPALADKPANETATNIAMWRGQRLAVWVQGNYREANDKSDVVKGLHFEHADEPLPDGRLLNTYGHHSFYVVYQWARRGGVPAPIPPITAPPIGEPSVIQRLTDLEMKVVDLQAKVKALSKGRR